MLAPGLRCIRRMDALFADDVCPICFNTFLATLAEEEVGHAMDSPAHPVDELGVTKLQNTCGHIFCRKELRVV